MAIPKTNSTKTTTRKVVKKAIATQEAETVAQQEKLQEAIRLKAYELYMERGCTHGSHEEDWRNAEQIIRDRNAV